MTRHKAKTYYNRSQAARILGKSRAQLIRWQRESTQPDSPLSGTVLYVPTRPGCPWDKTPEYHRRQVELMAEALAQPDKLKEIDERWRMLLSGIGVYTVREAEEIGVIDEEGKDVA